MKMAIIAFALLSTACAGVRHEAREIKEDFIPRNAYERSVLKSSVLPGGGWIYECNDDRGPCEHDVSPGVAYFAATVGVAFVLANGVNKGSGMQIAAAGAGLFVIRFTDIRWGMHAAKHNAKR